jgi:ABC-type nitrate/sulfonate/bicarbonate transport system substrate-binding protein
MSRQRLALSVALFVLLAGCGSEGGSSPTSSGSATTGASSSGVTKAGITPERCAANKAAGKITYLSGFDFSASASIVDVIVAQQKGYFQKMCLDVELKASFSTTNYPLVAANEAQFASGGSYTEVLDFAKSNDAQFVVVAVEGKTAIDALIMKEGQATTLADLKGKTIGVKSKLQPSIKAMLAKAGLVEGTDYTTVGIDGFDPKVHIALPGIAGFTGYKSNEPGQLDRAGIKYTLFDPSKDDIPGSFGIIYTNAEFVTEHPTAAQDFVRATMKGLEDAIADPDAAAQAAVDLINSHGNPNFLSPEGEQYRWRTESGLVTQFTPAGEAVGAIDPALLQAEIDAYAEIGIFAEKPSIAGSYDESLIAGVYGPDHKVIWPATST